MDPHPHDVEKAVDTVDISSSKSEDIGPLHVPERGRFSLWNSRIKKPAFLEERGITRVMPNERHAPSVFGYVQMVLLWFSANITANNLAVGLLGPLLFSLGFTDSAFTTVFGVVVGSAATAYMSIWGAQSGNRTMVSIPCQLQNLIHDLTGAYRLWLDTLWDTGQRRSPAF